MFGIKPLYWVFINSAVAFVYLFVISKLLGKKQIAQLEFIDYTVGISLGSIAADMAADAENPFYYYLIAMSVFFLFALCVSVLGRKSTFLKRVLKGKPATLIYDGKINYKELKRNKIDVNDLLSMLREKDYFDIADVAYAVFEPSGDLSVLPVGAQKPVVLADVDKSAVKKSSLTNVLVADGVISGSGLDEIDKTDEWLFKQIGIKDRAELKNIILAVYDDDNACVRTYRKDDARG